jgi:uncharacterized protein
MRYGKFIFFMLILLFTAYGAVASDRLLRTLTPQQGQAVYDYADVIFSAEEQQLESMVAELRQKTGAAIVVVTLKTLDGGDINEFSTRLFEKWGIGEKGKDNGLLFLAAMQEREMRIEVGYGLEGAVPDAKAGRIIREQITPYFQRGQTGQGIVIGVAALSKEIAEEYNVELTGAAQYSQNTGSEQFYPIVPLIFFVLFLLCVRPGVSYRSGGGFGSGGFGGGGSSGGGGFGGGSSGGGGARGSW